MSDFDRSIAEAIIDAVEPGGMLNQSVEEIYSGLLPFHEELEEDEVYAVLHRVQQFDPPGVASQNVRECLLIQLRQFAPNTPHLKTAIELVNNHLDLLGNRDFDVARWGRRLQDGQAAILTLDVPKDDDEHQIFLSRLREEREDMIILFCWKNGAPRFEWAPDTLHELSRVSLLVGREDLRLEMEAKSGLDPDLEPAPALEEHDERAADDGHEA